MFWIFVLISFLQRLSVIDAACSNPIPLSAGIWKTSNRGTWTIPAARNSIQNFRVKYQSASSTVLTMNCEDDSSDADGYILFKSSTTVTFAGMAGYVYACIKFEQAQSSTGKYYFYLGASLTTSTDSSSGKINIYERISILPTAAPYLFSTQCTDKSTSGERAHVAIKDGSESGSAETCPTGIQGTFSYSGTSCSSQFLDVCSTLTEFNFNYTVCADPQFFSASGQLYCVHSTSSGGYNYLTLYNTDTSPDSSNYFQYVCLVYSTSDLTVRVSINPSECYDSTLHTPTLNSHESGITQTLTNYGDSVCYHPETSTDLTWLYILIAVIVVVVIIVIIIIIICILKQKKKKKPDEESIKSSESEDEEEDVKQDDEKSTHSQQQQDQEQQQEEKEVDDDGRPIVVKEYDRTSIDSGIQQDKKEEKGDEGSSDEKTDEKQTNKNIINVKEQEKSERDSEEENEEEEDENESRKSDDDETGESRPESDGKDSVDEIERNIHKIGMKKKNDYQPQGELSKVLVSREMEEKMRTKNQEGKWSKMKKLFRKKTKKVKDIDQQKNKEKEDGDDALPSDLDDDDKLPRERNVAPFLAEYHYKKKMDERFEQDHEREEIQLRKQIYTESDDEDFADIFDESDEGDDEDDGFDEKDAQKRKELDKNLKNQEKQQKHFDENNKYKSDDESREKDKRHGIDRDMTDDEILKEKQRIKYLNRKQVPGDSDDENLTEDEKKKRKQRKDEQAKDSGVDSPDYKREKSDIPFISENEDEEGDEDVDLPPGYIRDSSGQIIRIEDGKAMSDIEMHQIRKFAKLGVIFNVPRLKRTSSGRPTGEYIVDPFGPKIDPTIQINGDTRGDHSKAKHPRPSKDKRGFGRGSFDNDTRQWSSDGKRQRSGDVGRQRSGDVGRQRSGDVGRGRVDDARQRTDEEQKKSDDVGRQRVDDGGRQRFVDGRRQRVDDGGRLRVDDVIRQRSVVFDIDGRSDISDVSTLSSLSTGKDSTFENRELLKKRLFKNRRKRGFDNRLYQSEDGPPRELNDLVRVVPQTTNQRLANGRVPLPGTVISRNDSLRNKYDPEQQQMYREGLETDKRFLKESPLMHRRPPGAPREAFMNGEDADDIHVVMENEENEERQRQMEEGVNIGSGDEFFLIGSKQEKQEPLFTYIRGPNQVITRAHPSYGDSLHRNHDLRHTFPWSLLYKNPVRESSIIDINMADRRNAPKSADDIARREIDDKRLKELLEELYTDKKYFDHVIQSTDPNPEPIIDERDLAEHGRDFLLERAEYWDERGVRIPRPPQTALGLRMSRLLTNHPDSGRVSNISYASTVTPTPHPFQASDSQEQVETKEAFVRREHTVS